MKVSVEYPYVCKDRDRHGNTRYYFRRDGKKTRIRALPASAEFQAAYDALAKALSGPSEGSTIDARPALGTFRWLCVQYMSSIEFQQLDARTQYVRRQVIDHMCREPVAPGAAECFADFPLKRFNSKAVRVLRDRKARAPHAANTRMKAIRRLFKWAVEEEVPGVAGNPARDVAFLKGPPGGFHSWTAGEVNAYEERHPVGTTARLALALLLYTGQRRSDVILFGRQHVRDGALRFTQQKNRNRKPISLELPILPALQRVIDASVTGDLTFLVNEYGNPFSAAGFGNKMRQWCNEAGLTNCSAHGLRKAGAAIAAENGATAHELMSIFGWLTLKEAERYTRAAEQKKIAARAMSMLERSERGT